MREEKAVSKFPVVFNRK